MKSSRLVIGAVALMLSLSMTANIGWAAPTVLPSDSKPYGMDYGGWGAAWWQWVTLGTPQNHVLFDTTGERAYNNQLLSGPVFFLAGTWTGAPVVRNVTVSPGKALFLPIFNWVLSSPEDVPAGTTDSLKFITNTLNSAFNIPGDYLNNAAGLVVTVKSGTITTNVVDPSQIDAYRGQSAPFSMYFPPDCFEVVSDHSSITGLPYQAGLHYPTVSDGYWVMLAPLDVGQHEIHILASGIYGNYQDVTYNLQVTPLPTTLLFFGSGLLGLLGLRASRRQ
jgi:hypothetical protein